MSGDARAVPASGRCQYVAMVVDGTMSHRVPGSRLSAHHLLVVTRQLCKSKCRVRTGILVVPVERADLRC